MNDRKTPFLVALAIIFLASTSARADVNYHLVGWSNTFIPGSGRMELGEYAIGGMQAVYEIGSFVGGYNLSNGATFTLDGFQTVPPDQKLKRSDEIGIESELYGDLLQEFAIKAHMVNTFEAYRLAAWRSGEHPDNIDDKPIGTLFMEPFDSANLTNPWVFIPIIGVLAYTLEDFFTTNPGTVSRLSPYSNFLYGFNYGVWQPIGSGAPEEMFFRGFLQNEFMDMTHSPYLAIPMSTALFAYSHAPTGRLTAAIAGGYLGFLADHYHGRLGPGITVHFWSDLILGIETLLQNSKAQSTTPPATFSVQINY